MPRFGRRPTYLLGMAVMIMALMAIGILQVWGDRPSVGYAQSALCLFWTFAFQLSVGQLGWALPAEVGSTRLRQKTICLARNAYYIVNVVSGVLQSYFINPTAWNLSGYTGKFMISCYTRFFPTKQAETYDYRFLLGRYFHRCACLGIFPTA